MRLSILPDPRIKRGQWFFKQSELLEPGTAQVGVVAEIREEVSATRRELPTQVANLPVDLTADQAATENAAEHVLLHRRGEHQRRWHRTDIVQHVHPRQAQVLIGVRVVARADGDEKQAISANWPLQAVAAQCRHQEQLKGGVVEARQRTVRKHQPSPTYVDHLGREVGRSSRTPAHELPERKVEVAVRPASVVEPGTRGVGDRPR